MRVALICNLKKNVVPEPGAPPDALAEYDSEETADALRDALQAAGHDVVLLEGDETLLDSVRQATPDLCFNIAEGLGGDAREAQVPALLEMLGIPYTCSRVLAQAVSLDKGITKRLWRDACLPTAPFQVFRRGDEPLDPLLIYPLFVKPLREGTGKGINPGSVVHGEAALRRQLRWVIDSYGQPALVEEYLSGREFTVGLMGNGDRTARRRRPDLYGEEGYHVFPVLEIDAGVGAGEGVYNAASKSYNPGEAGAPLYLCPADIPGALERTLKWLAVEAFEAIGALDVARVDFRVGDDGRPYLLEINTLPGLNPVVSDICIMARAEGVAYDALINEIVELALARYDGKSDLPKLVTTGGEAGTAVGEGVTTSPLFQAAPARSLVRTRAAL
jgi:D-alanine-D-alanine ligase